MSTVSLHSNTVALTLDCGSDFRVIFWVNPAVISDFDSRTTRSVTLVKLFMLHARRLKEFHTVYLRAPHLHVHFDVDMALLAASLLFMWYPGADLSANIHFRIVGPAGFLL